VVAQALQVVQEILQLLVVEELELFQPLLAHEFFMLVGEAVAHLALERQDLELLAVEMALQVAL
jgi:hypothetical protein